MKKKILIIDDEKDFLTITAINLEMTGKFEVMTLLEGKDHIDAVHKFVPDIIVLDMVMPGINGIEICKALRKDPVSRETPIVILSAIDAREEKDKVAQCGISVYLTKPINADSLIEAINKVFEDEK